MNKQKALRVSIIVLCVAVVLGSIGFLYVYIDVIQTKVLTPAVKAGGTFLIQSSGFVASSRFNECEGIVIETMTDGHGTAYPIDFFLAGTSLPPNEQRTGNPVEDERNYLRSGSGIVRKGFYDHLITWTGPDPYIEDIGGCIGLKKPGSQPDFLKHITSVKESWVVLPGTPAGTYQLKVSDPNLRERILTLQVTAE